MSRAVNMCACLLLILFSMSAQFSSASVDLGVVAPNQENAIHSSKTLSSQQDYATQLAFAPPVVESWFGYDLVTVPGCGLLATPGQPVLPRQVVLVAVPFDGVPVSAEAVDMTASTLESVHNLAPPVRYFLRDAVVPEFIPYDRNSTFPESNVKLLGTGVYRGTKLAAVEVIPLTYDAKNGIALFHPQVAIRVTWTNDAGSVPDMPPLDASTESFAVGHFLNYEMVRSTVRARAGASSTSLLIITSAGFSPLFDAFIAEKASMGIANKIMTVESIASSYSGRDLPEKIWNAIHSLYISDGVRYVLLGGSHSIVPGRYFWYDDDEGGWADRNLKLTDRYYGLMDDSNWDDDNDRRWGEKTELFSHGDEIGDWLQDIAVGRFPARTDVELKNMIQKTIMYEKYPPASDRWNRMLLAGAKVSDAWFGQGDGKTELQNLFTSWTNLHSYYSRNELYESDGTLNTGNVQSQLKNGVGVVNSVSHGGPYATYLLSGNTWASTSDTLDSNVVPYFWYAYACLTAMFDAPSRSLGEYLVGSSSSGGAVAFVGASRVSYGMTLYSLVAYDGANNEMHTRFWNTFLGSGNFKPGVTLMYATNEFYSAAWGGVDLTDIHNTRKTLLEYVLFGDPTLSVRLTSTSTSLSASLLSPPSPSNGATVTSSPVTFKAQVTANGFSLEGAAVTIYVDGSPASGCSGGSDSSGYYSCSYSPTQSGHTYNWYAAASKSGYNSGTSQTWSFTFQPTYSVTFQQSGIPSGITWGVTVGGTRYASSSSRVTVSGLSGSVGYSYDSWVPGSGGTYACSSGCSGTVSGATTVTATYTFPPPGQLSVGLVSPPSPSNGTAVTSSPVTLEAQVTGSGPIQGATVTIYVDSVQACSGTSDSSGYYSCSCSLTQSGHMYSWYATASKSGYNLGASPTWAFTYQPSPVTAPSLDLFPPQISGLTVTANGVALPGTAGTSITRINWIWGDGTSEDAWFPATHTYTQAGTYTISVTAYQSDGLSTTKNMQVVLVEGGSELSYDDGSAEFGFIAWPHAVAAVRFTPSSPIQLVGVKFYVFGAMNPVKIHVFDSNLRLLYSQTVTPSEGWYLVDISSASIYVNRDFYVGWEWPNGGEPWFGVDNNSPSAGRSYLFTLGDSNLGLPRANENYMIRAIVAPAPTFTANLGARSNLGETLTGLKAYVDGVVYVLPNTATLTKGSHKFATSPEFSTSTLSYIFDHWEDEAGTIVSTSGFFTYDLKTNKSFYAVYKPKPAAGQLALSVTAPSTSTVATEFEVSATLSNVGGGRVDSIVFKIILPPGMALRTGEAASISVGSLTPGASTSQVWHVTSSAQGTRTLFVAAWGIGEDGRVVATFQRLTITINVSGQQELKYDGGTPNFGANPTSSGLAYLINIYSLPAGWQSAKIVTVRYYIYANPAKFKVHIFDSNRADLITPVEVTPQSTGWFDVDLSAWNIVVSGDFYVAIEYAMPGGPDIGSHYPPEWGQYRSTSPTWYGSGPSGQGWVNVLENAYIRVVVSTNVAATSQDGKSMGLGVDKNFEPFCHASSPQRMPTMWRKDASALAVAVPEKSTSLRGQALSATRIMGLQVGHL